MPTFIFIFIYLYATLAFVLPPMLLIIIFGFFCHYRSLRSIFADIYPSFSRSLHGYMNFFQFQGRSFPVLELYLGHLFVYSLFC